MTKLPVVGKKYRMFSELFHETFTVEIVHIFDKHVIIKHADNSLRMEPFKSFLRSRWEELPDQEPTIKESPTLYIGTREEAMEKDKKVQEALEELKPYLFHEIWQYRSRTMREQEHKKLMNKIRNLVNAIEDTNK